MLVWLAGDIRLMRPDGRMFFRSSDEFDGASAPAKKGWQDSYSNYSGSSSATDADETDYVTVLRVINEFLPVKELAGRPIHPPVLQRFGLVNNEKLDHFLATAFGKSKDAEEAASEAAVNARCAKTRTRIRQPKE